LPDFTFVANFQVIDLLLQKNIRHSILFLFDGSEEKSGIENKLNKKKILVGTGTWLKFSGPFDSLENANLINNLQKYV
jgi:hypothetical protein